MKTVSGIGKLNPEKLFKEEDNKSMMDRYGFKFKMYDIVTTKVKADIKFMVLERELQECPGGVQRHYKLRAFLIKKDYAQQEPILLPGVKLDVYNEAELKLAE